MRRILRAVLAATDHMLPGWATSSGVARLTGRCAADVSPCFYRSAQGVPISSIGIGTAGKDTTSAACSAAVEAALASGINLIDTSINYRGQLAERAAGNAIRSFAANGGQRDEIMVCTKAGYLVPGAMPESVLGFRDAAVGHCMTPAFLDDQLQRSRANLGLETIDVYYLHNPETQLQFIDGAEFMKRIRAALEFLERAVSDKFVRHYGAATWTGLRFRAGGLSLPALVEAAREVAGDGHHFRFVQLPFNLAMPEACTLAMEGGQTILDIAGELNLTVVASATLSRARLARNLPGEIADLIPGLTTDAQRAIQFTRSTPGIASALVGMGDQGHVRENLAVAKIAPMAPDEYSRFLALMCQPG